MSEDEAAPPSAVFASGGLSWRRVNTPRKLSTIAKAAFLIGSMLPVAALVGDPLSSAVFALGLSSLFAYPLFIISYIFSLSHTSFAGGLLVSSADLTVQAGLDERIIPRRNIAGALVVEREMFGALVPSVEIELTNGDLLTARLPDPGSAHAIVRALGFGVGGRRVKVSLATPTRRLIHPMLGLFAYSVALFGASAVAGMVGSIAPYAELLAFAVYPVIALLLYTALERATRAAEVTVGDDGVLVSSGMRRALVPRHEIVSAVSGTSKLVIERRNGRHVTATGVLLDHARRAALGELINERVLAPAGATTTRLAQYDRGGRTLAAWRQHLARAMQETSYRENAATVDDAVAVLRSAEATAEQRVGAALALRVAGQPPARIRVAVDGAADEHVREALRAVAETEDDAVADVAIEKALQRLP